MANGVLIFAETSGGAVRPQARELFGVARELAGTLGGQVAAAVLGAGVDRAVAEAAALGADRVLVRDRPELAQFTVDPYARALDAAIAATEPALVLLSGTTSGRDLAAFLSGRHRAPHLVDCVRLSVEGDEVAGVRPVYGAKMLTEARARRDGIVFATVRSGAVPAPEGDTSRSVAAEPLDVSFAAEDLRVEFVELKGAGSAAANLEAAEIVVVGGRGLGSAEAFELVKGLAAALDGAVGATRAVTDLGWRPHHEQVGQTGRAISPKLYVGVGVSGAVQHTVGMRGSEVVVAINRDPDAPIFSLADFGIVGDIFEIVPKLTERIREARGR